jgi:hypothetical protein
MGAVVGGSDATVDMRHLLRGWEGVWPRAALRPKVTISQRRLGVISLVASRRLLIGAA